MGAMAGQDPEEELDIGHADEEESGLAWGVEVVFVDERKKSVFHSARRVVLRGEWVEIQLLNGKFTVYPYDEVRKVLSMRAEESPGYTDEDISSDEIY